MLLLQDFPNQVNTNRFKKTGRLLWVHLSISLFCSLIYMGCTSTQDESSSNNQVGGQDSSYGGGEQTGGEQIVGEQTGGEQGGTQMSGGTLNTEDISTSDFQSNPMQKGPASVGYQVHSLTYLPPFDLDGQSDTERTLRLAVWYPTDQSDGDFAQYPVIPNRQTAYLNALPNLTQKAPLLLYSHGKTVWPE